jgi:alkylated DNA repair dioxygenase AlkB
MPDGGFRHREEPIVVKASWQPSLFGGAPATPSQSAGTHNRLVQLDAASWVDVLSGWLPAADALFACLLDTLPWQQRTRPMFEQMVLEPRLTAELPSLDDASHPALRHAADALSARYGVRFDHLWLNLYRDGQDSTAWHGDRISCRRDLCIVPVLTLGATRRFLIKPRAGGPSHVFRPGAGDVLVMGGRCQRDWVHSVPKAVDVVGARISVNFQSSEQGRTSRRRIFTR